MRLFALGAIFILTSQAWATTMVMKSGYWIRMNPTSRGEGVRVNEREQVVTVVETANEWNLVKFADGKRYWVSASALIEEVSLGGSDAPDVAQTFYAETNGWPIRSHAGTKTAGSTVTDHVSSSTPLELVATVKDGDGDTWYQVKYTQDGKESTGYIYEGRVTIDTDASTEACVSCAQGFIIPSRPNRPDLAAIAAEAKGYQLGANFVTKCNSFITREGLGDTGRLMVDAAKRIAKDCLYNGNIFKNVCSNYDELSESQKTSFLALVFASIAQDESKCDPGAQNAKGTNDIADGLFQLEYSQSQREAAGRSDRYCAADRSVNSQSYQFQSECTISTIKDTVCAHSGRQINYDFRSHGLRYAGYWAELRGDGKITQLIRNEAKRWGLCR